MKHELLEGILLSVILENCRLIDGISNDIKENIYITVESDVISRISSERPENTDGYEVIDCEGQYVLPGLIDSHVHLVWDGSGDPQSVINHLESDVITLRGYKHSLDYLNLGITTVRDVGSPNRTVLHVRDMINAKMLAGPTIITSGAPICMTGGHVYYLGYESDGADEVRKNTRKVMKEGADLVKVMATGGIYTLGEEPGSAQLTKEELRAAKEEARKKNKKVAAHADGIEGIMNCLEVGIDTIEHGIYADEEALQLMKKQGTYLVPTMVVMRRLATHPDVPPWAQDKAKEVIGPHEAMLKRAIELGIKIATGTDCGSPVTPPEYYFDELLIMEELGMSRLDVIKASTSVAAECLGLEDRGTLEKGKKADLILVNKNPLEDLSVLKDKKRIMKDGLFIN